MPLSSVTAKSESVVDKVAGATAKLVATLLFVVDFTLSLLVVSVAETD